MQITSSRVRTPIPLSVQLILITSLPPPLPSPPLDQKEEINDRKNLATLFTNKTQ